MKITSITGRCSSKAQWTYKKTESGMGIFSFSIATDNYISKEKPKNTTWTNCTSFGKDADYLNSYLQQGDTVFVVGEEYDETYYSQHYNREITKGKVKVLKAKIITSTYDNLTKKRTQPGYEPAANTAPKTESIPHINPKPTVATPVADTTIDETVREKMERDMTVVNDAKDVPW